MVWKGIEDYYARWDYVNHRGKLGVKDVEGAWHWITTSEPGEFKVLIDLLRNEKPVYWDEREWLRTSYEEEPGEEESLSTDLPRVCFWAGLRKNRVLDGQIIDLIHEFGGAGGFLALRAYVEVTIEQYDLSSLVSLVNSRAPGTRVLYYCSPLRYLIGSRCEKILWEDPIPEEYRIDGIDEEFADQFPDITNPDYREWAIGEIVGAHSDLGTDGVCLDRFTRLPTNDHPNGLADYCDANPDYAAEYASGVDTFLSDLDSVLGGRIAFNGLWRWNLSDQESMLSTADGATVEYFGLNPRQSSHSFTDDILPYLNTIASNGKERKIYVFGRGAWEYSDYEDDYLWQRYLYASYLLAAQTNTMFHYHATFQCPTKWGRSGGLDLYEDWRVDIGIPRGAYSDDDGILARQYSDGLVLVAPDDGAGGSYMLPRPIYTPDGDVLRGLVELDPGGGLILSNVEHIKDGTMSLPVVAPDSPYLDWRGAALITSGSGSPYLSLEDQGLAGEHDILLDAVRSLDPYRIIEARVKISSGSAMLFIAEVDDPDDADMWIIVEVAVSDYESDNTSVLYRYPGDDTWPLLQYQSVDIDEWCWIWLTGSNAIAGTKYTFRRWSHVRVVGTVCIGSIDIFSTQLSRSRSINT